MRGGAAYAQNTPKPVQGDRDVAGSGWTAVIAWLDLPPTGTDHRRVLAVLKYLGTS